MNFLKGFRTYTAFSLLLLASFMDLLVANGEWIATYLHLNPAQVAAGLSALALFFRTITGASATPKE